MTKKRVVLTFPKDLVSSPIIYHLVKDYDLVTNILRAQIMPDEEGKVVLELDGDKSNIEKGLKFLKKQSIHTELLGQDIKIYDDKCINCGACTSVCLSEALSLNKKTFELEFDRSKCILCGLCLNTCPVKAIEITF
ncbi:MAG: 4Fe-4S binding protein [Endomicrobiales bacterium]|nr:4Fe-4S binding protein [Endomicrobiales bacterium]